MFHNILISTLAAIICCGQLFSMNYDGEKIMKCAQPFYEKKFQINIPFEHYIRNEILKQHRGLVLALLGIEAKNNDTHDGKQFGQTFQTKSIWNILTAYVIKNIYNTTGNTVPVGSWGCGQGYSDALFLLAGANIRSFDVVKENADKTNRLLWKHVKETGLGTTGNPGYGVSVASVENPGPIFMNRQNIINTAFNVMHYLTPEQNNKLLENLYKNTLPGGYVVITALSFESSGHDPKALNNESEYPGYLLYEDYFIFSEDKEPLDTIPKEVFPVTKKNAKLLYAPFVDMKRGSYIPKERIGQSLLSEWARVNEYESSVLLFTQQRVYNLFTFEVLRKLLDKHGLKYVQSHIVSDDNNFILMIAQKPNLPL